MGVSLPDRTLIKQPVNQTLRVEAGVLQLTERWKGRYEWCRDVCASLFDLSAVGYGKFRQEAGTLSSYYDGVPSSVQGYEWILANGTVDECDAGENGILQLIWNAEISSGTISPENWPVTETWSISWQPENYDVYAYCANPKDHVSDGGNPIKSQRTAIEACLHPPLGNTIVTQQQLYSENNGLMQELNSNEKKILTWKLEGQKVIKHHPLITQTKTWQNIPKSQINAMLNSKKGEVRPPDVINNPGEQFGLSGYTWVSQGSNMNFSQADVKKNEYTLQVQTQWLGSLSVIAEFYSNQPNVRWEFGQK